MQKELNKEAETKEEVIETETQEEVQKEITQDDLSKSYEELKKEAEEAEARVKELKEEETELVKKQNMIIRRDKAREKAETPKEEVISDDLDTRDLITLAQNKISENSEKAEILKKYKSGGLIKSYEEGLEHLGIKAEFEAIEAKNNAKSVIDENDTDEVKIQTTREIINRYKASGEVPDDPKLQEAIALSNLKEMGL